MTLGAFLLYAAISVLCCVFVFYLVPETKGKTLEEMHAYFEAIVHGGSTGESSFTAAGTTSTGGDAAVSHIHLAEVPGGCSEDGPSAPLGA